MRRGMGAGLLLASCPALAQTPAGTVIVNTATATYDNPTGTGTLTVSSNAVSLTVDELLDVSVAKQDSSDVVALPSATGVVLTYKLTNEGNGSEAFNLLANLSISGDDFDPTAAKIILDDGDGIYEPSQDTLYVAGANDPVLASGASQTLFLLADLPAATDGQRSLVRLSATAKTGSGTPGTSFAGQGSGGGDAVVGATTATDQDDNAVLISDTQLVLTKAATVADPFGGTSQVPGSTITYTLTATISGTGTLDNLKIGDVVPAKTTYVASSITLDGAPMTDATGDDAGEISGGKVTVTLGSQGAGSRVVAFKVKVD